MIAIIIFLSSAALATVVGLEEKEFALTLSSPDICLACVIPTRIVLEKAMDESFTLIVNVATMLLETNIVSLFWGIISGLFIWII